MRIAAGAGLQIARCGRCGLRIADCGLPIADCGSNSSGLRIAGCSRIHNLLGCRLQHVGGDGVKSATRSPPHPPAPTETRCARSRASSTRRARSRASSTRPPPTRPPPKRPPPTRNERA
eukprot:3749204-Alexandrium_andersonii.AAC.1